MCSSDLAVRLIRSPKPGWGSQGSDPGRGEKPQKGRRLRKKETPALQAGNAPERRAARSEAHGSKGGIRSLRRAQARCRPGPETGAQALRAGHRSFLTPGARRALEGRTSGGERPRSGFGPRGTDVREDQGSEVARRAPGCLTAGPVTVGRTTESTGLERGSHFPCGARP